MRYYYSSSTSVPTQVSLPRVTLTTPDFVLQCVGSTSRSIYEFVQSRIDSSDEVASIFPVWAKEAPSFVLYFRGKPLSRRPIPLLEYGCEHLNLTIQYSFMIGGLKSYPQLAQVQMVLNDRFKHQGAEGYWFDKAAGVAIKQAGIDLTNPESILKFIEDIQFFLVGLIKSKCAIDVYQAVVLFWKLRITGPFYTQERIDNIMGFFSNLFNFEEQGLEEALGAARACLGKYSELKKSPIFTKLYKAMMYALSFSLFEGIGIKFSTFHYTTFEAEAIKRKFHMGEDLVYCMLDTLLFVAERGWQCVKTGSLDPIYHSGSQYEKWYDQAQELKLTAKTLHIAENKKKRFAFLSDLREHIEKGEAIRKHATRIGAAEKKLVSATVNELKLCLAEETTKREAQKERKAPFSVLLYGGSSIGKSTLTKMLFYQYGKVFDLPIDSEYKYTRNCCANFWDGFNSSQWCVQLDDIAYQHPSRAAQGDPSIMEMLQVINNVPFVPDQASLEDKGRTPMRAELVIATTNCEDINAYHYFQTPLAVQRRLPYILDVVPKPEHLKDECMLDSSTVQMEDGEWPDYWQYTVKRVVPSGTDRRGQQGRTEEIAIFDHTDDLLAWFAKVAKDHEAVQVKVEECDKAMAKIDVCATCYFPAHKCKCKVQVLEQMYSSVKDAARKKVRKTARTALQSASGKHMINNAVSMTLGSESYDHFIQDQLASSEEGSELSDSVSEVGSFASAHEEPVLDIRAQFRSLGEQVSKGIGENGFLLKLAGAIGVLAMLYKGFSMIQNIGKDESWEFQGLSDTVGQTPVATGKEKENVWFKDSFELTSFDSTPQMQSWCALDFPVVQQKIQKSCVSIKSVYTTPEGRRVRSGKATCLVGHLYLANNHTLPEVGTFRMKVISTHVAQGINGNIEISVAQGDIKRFPDKDLAIFRIRNLPPGPDLTQLITKQVIRSIQDGCYLGRRDDGSVYNNTLRKIDIHKNFVHAKSLLEGDIYKARAGEETVDGDCGALLLMNTGYGPMIAGIHSLANGTDVRAAPVTRAEVKAAMEFFPEPHIKAGVPELSAPGYQRKLVELDRKSTMRYIEQGSANVYGSFEGFRIAPKTLVKNTIMHEAVRDEGYEVKHAAPVMKGWGPWRNGALDLVQPVTLMDNDILAECADAFVADILEGCTPESLAEVMVYDNFTAVNGAKGVKFVDKINRNSSAGAPFRKTKKHFLEVVPEQGGLLDAVMPTEVIMARVDDILTKYFDGQRACPVFTGSLKDEALKHKKVLAELTRIFAGAPMDFSIVDRKYLLAVTRLFQNNRYVTEGAVGINATSKEWGELRAYLTKFGVDRLIAGDYKTFDKKMSSILILLAFDILRRICAACGFTELEQQVIQCIGEDTAFPFIDFNGDLIEFFGSNPSGHPLTVLINGIVNSLYMRYCYRVLNPAQEVKSFKEFVALITYGDDMASGVSKLAPWFNHTSVQKVLADVGIVFTMADKEAASVPYIHIDEVSFLKRTWRWDEDVHAYLAPLEEESIAKSLLVGVRSKAISASAQAIQVISSANREYWFYGRETYEEKQAMFRRIITRCNLSEYEEDSTLPSWEALYDQFWA